MRVRYTPRARADLEAIIDYLASQSPQGARNVQRAFDATLTLISSFPESGKLTTQEVFASYRSDAFLTLSIGASKVRKLGSYTFATVGVDRGEA